MAQIESQDPEQAFLEALARAHALLEPPAVKAHVWPALAAAGFFAVSALVFATAALLAPPAQVAPAADVRGPI